MSDSCWITIHLFLSFTSNGVRHVDTNWKNPYWSSSTRLLGELRSSWFLCHCNDLHGQNHAWNILFLKIIDFWSFLPHPKVVTELMCKSQNSFIISIFEPSLDPVDVDLLACENTRLEIFLSKSILTFILIFSPVWASHAVPPYGFTQGAIPNTVPSLVLSDFWQI